MMTSGEKEKRMMQIEEYLRAQGISEELIGEAAAFRSRYEVDPKVRERLAEPAMPFYGKDTLEMAVTALIQGENLLLCGGKATGKNVLCETLS